MVVEPGEVAARRRELHWQRRGGGEEEKIRRREGEDKEWKNKNTNTQTHNNAITYIRFFLWVDLETPTHTFWKRKSEAR